MVEYLPRNRPDCRTCTAVFQHHGIHIPVHQQTVSRNPIGAAFLLYAACAQIQAMLAGQTALGRVGEPEEIGGVVASLLSTENRWINAQNIEVSGGYII